MVDDREYISNPTIRQLKETVGKVVEIYFKFKNSKSQRIVGKLTELKEDREASGVHGYYLGFSTLVFLKIGDEARIMYERSMNQRSSIDPIRIAYDCHYNRVEMEDLKKIRIVK